MHPLTVTTLGKLIRINFTDPGSNDNNRAQEGEEATILVGGTRSGMSFGPAANLYFRGRRDPSLRIQ